AFHGGTQGALEQVQQRRPVPFGGLLVVGGRVGLGVPVRGTAVDLAAGGDSRVGQRAVEPFDLFLRQRVVLVGVAEVELGGHVRGEEVRALRRFAGQVRAVAAGRGGHALRVVAGGPQRPGRAEAVAGGTDGAVC